MSEQTTSSKKISVGLILSWIFGVLFAFIGIISVFSEPIPGLIMLIMGAVLLPPVTKFVERKWKLKLSRLVKAGVIVLGFILFSATIDTSSISTTQELENPIEEQHIIDEESIISDEQPAEEVLEEQSQIENNNNENEEKTEIIPQADEEITEQPQESTTVASPPPSNPEPVTESIEETTSNDSTDSEEIDQPNNDEPAVTGGHTFYTSSHYSSKFYYCDTDSAWQGLSPSYLRSYSSESALLSDYPTKTLHEPCK